MNCRESTPTNRTGAKRGKRSSTAPVDMRAVVRDARRAVKKALRAHKLLGRSIVVERNGKIVVIPPEEIDA